MDRSGALRTLGLSNDASLSDIKIAYRETAQILHPDRFAGNAKLQDRATEQFKNLQEAYEFLTNNSASSSKHPDNYAVYGRAQEIKAQLSGIAAARVQLQQQRDLCIDKRRTGFGMLVGGALVAFCLRRLIWVATIAGAVAFWGGFDAYAAHKSVRAITNQLDDLTSKKKNLLAELNELG